MATPVADAPRGYPLVGHLPAYLRDRLAFLRSCDDGSGQPVRLRLGRTAYLLTDAADVEHVLLRNFRNYSKTPRMTSRRGRELLGHGVLTSIGGEHLERRRTLQPLFSRKRVADFRSVVSEVVDEIAATWNDGAAVDVVAEMTRLSRRVILRTLLGRRPDEADLEQALQARQEYIEYRFRSFVPRAELVPRPVVIAHRRGLRRIDSALESAIAERRAATNGSRDLLGHLVAAGLSDDAVRDEALVLAVTGYETMAVALAWTWYLLALHPDAEARIQREADALRGDGAAPGTALAFTEAVLSESMRLYPPTWIFIRVALGPDRLPSGLELQAGAKLYLSQFVLHRSPRYFPDPERFDPSRFDAEEASSRPEFAYFPFGGGVRLCIGKPFALLEAVLAVSTIARRCRLSLEPGPPVEPEPGITLRPRGRLCMRVAARRPPGSQGEDSVA